MKKEANYLYTTLANTQNVRKDASVPENGEVPQGSSSGHAPGYAPGNASGNVSVSASVSASANVSGNASAKALLRLREMIWSGEVAGGARISELSLVELVGVSRTPIRAALMRLEQEGLLEALPNGGYAVRTFSERDISEAIELRGTTEGLCARLAAERGAPPVLLREARDCLLGIDVLLRSGSLSDDDFEHYVTWNEKFHQLLVEMAGSAVIAQQLERIMSLPFASPSSFVVSQANSPRTRDMFVVAQAQHWQALQAIEQREGSRAEAVMREHSRIAQTNLRDAVSGQSQSALPGVQLIRRR